MTLNPRRWLRAVFDALEALCSRAFTAPWNPLLQLGSLGWFFYWVVAISGIYLYVFFDTGITRAYDSLEAITHGQAWLGGVLRSLHRYAADAFVLLMLAHLLREWLFGHWSGFRRFSWLTGVPLLLFAFVSAIGGFWLNWDQLGQFSGVATAEWLDWLPIFALRTAALLQRTRADLEEAPVEIALRGKGFQLAVDEEWIGASPLTAAALDDEVRQWAAVGMELTLRRIKTPPSAVPRPGGRD